MKHIKTILFTSTAFILGGCASVDDKPTIEKLNSDALGYIQASPDGSDPQIHKSSRDGVEAQFEEGIFFCRNIINHIQNGRSFPRGEELRITASEFGFGLGPEDSPAVRYYAAEGNLKIFASRADTRIQTVLNFDTDTCYVMAFGAPEADAGHRRILDLGITSAEEVGRYDPLFVGATTNARWCYREPEVFPNSGKELSMSGGGMGMFDLTAIGRFRSTFRCKPKTAP